MSLSIITLLSLSILSSLQVITCANAVHAVFFLVLVFIMTSVLRLTLSMEFRALVFLMVYVGAIAVLFLFVVRRLNPDGPSRNEAERPSGNVPRLFRLSALGARPIIWGANGLLDSASWERQENSVDIIDWDASMAALGQVLYTTYVAEFLIAGLVLLVAMVGAITLTLASGATRRVGQQVHQQHSRDAERAVFRVA